jgi:hypothetical protein
MGRRKFSTRRNVFAAELLLAAPVRNSASVMTLTQKGDIPAIPGYQPLIPANCKPARIPALALHRLVNGRVAEQWEYEDSWSANIQAGLIDPDKMTFKEVAVQTYR